MSEDEQMVSETTEQHNQPYLTAEYKDGRLQIVEVTPYETDKECMILPDVSETEDGEQMKYMQVLDKDGLVQLDLLNLTLVKCADGGEAYRLVTNSEAGGSSDLSTVTCVLQTSDGDEEADNRQSYVMVEGSEDSMPVLLEPSSSASTSDTRPEETVTVTGQTKQNNQKPVLSPLELLQKAKALKKARAILSSVMPVKKRGRRRKDAASELPSPHEMMSSPSFKMYLYSCKLCSFQCNAVKELARHRSEEHGSGAKFRSGRAAHHTLQCARCPYRAATNTALSTHLRTTHFDQDTETLTITSKDSLDSAEVEEADVLVCGACGFESSDKAAFRQHVVQQHGTCLYMGVD